MHEVLALVGDKWTVLIVLALQERTVRFNALRKSIQGISQRMLTLTLRRLERDGMLIRTLHPTVPPKVEYQLSALGRSLLPPVLALADWAESHRHDISVSRLTFDERIEKETETRE